LFAKDANELQSEYFIALYAGDNNKWNQIEQDWTVALNGGFTGGKYLENVAGKRVQRSYSLVK